MHGFDVRLRTLLAAGLLAVVAGGCSEAEPAEGSAAGGEAAGGPDAAPVAAGCATYCDDVMAGCTGTTTIYADRETCLAACASFPATGTEGDAAGDTLQCRMYHATATKSDPAMHCPHASPSGGGVCGAPCEVYCRLMGASCGAADAGACLAACVALPADAPAGAAEGHSVQCRINHALSAAADASHCAHAALDGAGVCGADACEPYCDLAERFCVGQNALYPDRGACLAACAAMPRDGAAGALDGDSVQCRLTHLAVAATGDPAHCSHGAASGGGVCGSRCAAYCDQVGAHCPALYADRGSCLSTCAAFPEGSDFAAGGDSVQCRTMHASYPAAADAAHCAHAAPDGGGVCADEPAPAQSITVSGEVHELGRHLANNHVGVGGASVVALGVVPAASTLTAATAGTIGSYALTLPANGQVIFQVNKPGYYPTSQAATLGSTDIAGFHLVLAEPAWLDAVATSAGVDLATAFPCATAGLQAAGQCVYTAIIGRLLDDARNGAPQPVAGVPAGGFRVRGGADGADWHVMGPVFLNADGSPGAGVTESTASGLFVVFAEIPQIAAGYGQVALEVSVEWSGAEARYFGPTTTAISRPAGVTWQDVKETGIASPGPSTDVSFDGQVYPLLLPVSEGGFGCQGCHTSQSGMAPAGGLDLFGGPDVAYVALDPAGHRSRVNPDDPDASLLLTKPLFSAEGGNTHPIWAWASREDGAYQIVRQWIAEGGRRAVAARPVSFVAEIRPLLAGPLGCAACHSGDGFDVTGSAAALYAELVEEAATDAGGTGEARRINLSGRPERSLLLTNPLSGADEAHPQKPFFSTADPRYQLLYRWISEGYRNDGLCEEYCDQIQSRCTGDAAQYADRGDCLAGCGRLPATGNPGDAAGNTVQCRLFHAGMANNDEHCHHAGLSGADTCGRSCEVYCHVIQQTCRGGDAQYDSLGECLSACNGLATGGRPGELSGNTVQCRLTHLRYTVGDPSTHCPHAGPTGAGACE